MEIDVYRNWLLTRTMSTVLFANSVKKKINIKDFDLASMSKSPLKNGMTNHSGSSYSVNQFKRNRYESILYIYIYIFYPVLLL